MDLNFKVDIGFEMVSLGTRRFSSSSKMIATIDMQ